MANHKPNPEHRIKTNPLPAACFLRVEDQNAFLGLLNEYIATYCPQHRDELDLLTEAVYAKWKQTRLWVTESAYLEVQIAKSERAFQRELPTADAAAHLANAFGNSEKVMRLFLRYNTQLTRQYRDCLNALLELQARRQSPEPSPSTKKSSPFITSDVAAPNGSGPEPASPTSHRPQLRT